MATNQQPNAGNNFFCVQKRMLLTGMAAIWLLLCAAAAHAEGGTHTIWMMRHALAPGYGDPPTMVLGQCHTQRTLSNEGRAQARAAGQWLRQNGLAQARVVASPWCRTLETAELLGLGPVTTHPGLASFFQRGDAQATQAALVKLVQSHLQRAPTTPLMLVTHQVNISAYTGRGAASGEILQVRVNTQGKMVSTRSAWLPQ